MVRTRWNLAAALLGLGLLVAGVAYLLIEERPTPTTPPPSRLPKVEAPPLQDQSRDVSASRGGRSTAAVVPRPAASRCRVEGRVVDEEGAPVVGAAISVEETRAASETRQADMPVMRALTDSGGAFVVHGLDPGHYDVVAEAPGFGASGARYSVFDADRADSVVLVLRPAAMRLGRVVAGDDPVEGADVAISYVTGALRGPAAPWCLRRVSDAQGLFSFPLSGAPPGQAVDLKASKAGVGSGSIREGGFSPIPKVLTIRLSDRPDSRVIVSEPFKSKPPPAAGRVEGVVVDAAGRPVAGVLVSRFTFGNRPSDEGIATTDEAGRFSVGGVWPFRECRVGARRGFGPITWSERFDLAPGATVGGVRIVLGARPDLVVQVIGTDGRRVEGLAIVVEEIGDEPRARHVVRTDAKGEAAFESLRSETVSASPDPKALPAGVAVDDEFKPVVSVGGDARAPVVIRLRPEVLFRGIVVTEDGSPVGEGTVGLASLKAQTVSGVSGVTISPDRKPLFPYDEIKPGPASRYRRLGPRGEFSFAVGSMSEYEVVEVTRATPDGRDVEILVPTRRAVLKPDVENRFVVRKQE